MCREFVAGRMWDKKSLLVMAIAMIVVGLTACAKVKTEPFQQYYTTVQEAQKNLDSVLTSEISLSKKAYSHSYSVSDKAINFGDHLLKFPKPTPDQYLLANVKESGKGKVEVDKYIFDVPQSQYYLRMMFAQNILALLNAEFLKYAKLLYEVSAKDLMTTDQMKSTATAINANIKEILEVGKDKISLPLLSENTDLISSAAVVLFQQYLESKKKDLLRRALLENQKSVEAYSKQCQQIVALLYGTAQATYNAMSEYYQYIKPKFKSTEDGAKMSKADIKERLEFFTSMADMNEQLLKSTVMLKQLDQVYGILPLSHAMLREAVDQKTPLMLDVAGLVTAAQRVQALHDSLNASEK